VGSGVVEEIGRELAAGPKEEDFSTPAAMDGFEAVGA
jgi:hypothetical protein